MQKVRLDFYLIALLPALAAGQTATTTWITSSPSPSNYAQPVSLTATVTPAATGKVTFYDGVTVLGIGTLTAGQATLSTVMLPSGTRELHAHYQGDATHATSTSAPYTQAVIAGTSLGFQPAITYSAPTPGHPSAVVADLDGDGKQDVVLSTTPLTILLSNGDGTFRSNQQFVSGYTPTGIATGDFNGDGKVDIALALGNGSVGVLLGNGNGMFQAPLLYSLGVTSIALAAGDFNGDGNVDLAAVLATGDNVAILPGNGDGTFRGASTFPVGGDGFAIAVGDFNRDGKADLVVACNNAGVVSVLLGSGGGSFGAPLSVTLQNGLSAVVTADFNGDGEPDLAVIAQQAGTYVLLGNGNGTFGTPTNYAIECASVVAADFDGDGKIDLALGPLSTTGTIVTMRGNGNGTFGLPVTLNAGEGFGLLGAGDFNGDARADLFIGDSSYYGVILGGALPDLYITASHGIGFSRGQQGATYRITVGNAGAYPTFGSVNFAATLPSALVPTALSGTGWSCDSVAVTCTRSGALSPGGSYPPISLQFNVGSGPPATLTSMFTISGGGEQNAANDSFTDAFFARLLAPTTLAVSPNPSQFGQSVTLTAQVSDGATGRVDFYDGASQIASASLAGGQSSTTVRLPSGVRSLLAVYSGDATHSPENSAVFSETVNAIAANGMSPYTSYPANASYVAAADVNGDGKTDLIVADGVTVSVLLNAGGGFSPGNVYQVPGASPVVADFNGDGFPDIAVNACSEITLLAGNGDGTFKPATSVTSGISECYQGFAAADFNGDGYPDLLALSNGGLLLWIGNGNGTFQPSVTLTQPSSVPGLALGVADMNGDQRPDILLFNPQASTVAVFLGNGDGSIQPPISTSANFAAFTDVVGDYNGDGKPDVAIVSMGIITLLPGNGDGTFGSAITSTQSPCCSGSISVAGDFNGDGKLDIAYGGDAATVSLAFGNGNGTFQAGPTLPTGSNGGGIAVSDFNGDGKTDLAVAAGTSVEIFLGGQFSGLEVSSLHGRFTAGQTGTYQIAVANPLFASTGGTVTVTDTLPSVLTATAISGFGWTCSLSPLACTRSDALTSAASYTAISITVTVPGNLAASTLVNQISVTNGGQTVALTDPTSIVISSITTLVVSPNPSTFGQPTALTASVPPGASGTIQFFDAGVALGSAIIAGGQATYTTLLLPAGLNSVTATYAGDANFALSRSATTMQIVNASPATTFGPAVAYDTGAGPASVAVGDFNHDGYIDLVTANSKANTISVLPGLGDGTFGAHADYPVGANPVSVVVADFNNDGMPDVAVLNQSGDSVSILLGNPAGMFQPPIVVAVGENATSMAAADFNNDGNVDLVINEIKLPHDDTLTFLFGNGDGTFRFVPPGPDSNYVAFALGDFNHDGNTDIADASGVLLSGNGDGGFQESALGTSFGGGIAAGDLNSDGNMDLVFTDDSDDGLIYVMLGNDDGTFQKAVYYHGHVFATNIALADVNGDGKLDVITWTSLYPYLYVMPGDGAGSLGSPTTYSTDNPAVAFIAADFDGDGRTDLAAALPGANAVDILLGLLPPTLAVSSSHSDPFALGQTGAVYTLSVTNSGPGPTLGAVTVSDTLPAGLLATNLAGSGWSCDLTSVSCSRSDPLLAGAGYSAIEVTVSVGLNATSPAVNQVSVSGGGSAIATSSDLTSLVGPAVTIQTSPPGLQFSVDSGAALAAPQTLNLAPGSHTIGVPPTQTVSPGTRYVFTGWSDSGAASHSIVVSGPASFTASFQTQYSLTVAIIPPAGGSVSPPSGTFYGSGTTVTLAATPTAGTPYVFTSWTGDVSSPSNPLQVAMNSPVSLTANFDVPGFTCAISHDNTPSVADVQLVINESLGMAPPADDLTHDGLITVADVQKVINAVVGLGYIY